MDQLPTEIMKLWLSFLDDKSARIARVVCTDWFKWLKYSNFHVRFARAATLPQIVARLSTYQYPISLTLSKTFRMPFKTMAAEISKLTQLKSFNLIEDLSYESRFIPTEGYYLLTTLSNLEELYIEDRRIPAEILQHFPRLRKTFPALLRRTNDELLKHCTKMEFLRVEDFASFDLLQLSLKELHTDKIDLSLARLTNLKKLRLDSYAPLQQLSIDMSHITWLEELNLFMDLERVDGLELCKNLTTLMVIVNNFNHLQQWLVAPPNLESLLVYAETEDDVSFESFSHLTRLTFLDIQCRSVLLKTLGTSLQWLKFDIPLETPHNLIDITHLIQLTHLDIATKKNGQLDMHAITVLTNLQQLSVEMYNNVYPLNFNGLVNLTRLSLSGIEVHENSLQHLTNLQEFEFSFAFFSTEQWQSLKLARNLRLLKVTPLIFEFNCDYTVIEGLPLINLHIIGDKENEWQIVTKLTDLQALKVALTDDNDLKSLTALSNLTSLEIYRPDGYTNVVALHLTMLTNLQRVHLDHIKPQYLEEDLTSRMTRLYDFHYSYFDQTEHEKLDV